MKLLPLATGGHEVMVDDAVYEWLHWFRWYPVNIGGRVYSRRAVMRSCEGINRHIYLHKMIAGLLPTTKVSFINGNQLDCRRRNLKCVTEDGRIILWEGSNGVSHFNGVVWDGRYGLWRAHLDGMIIGYYNLELEAAVMYNKKARKYARETVNKFDFI